MTISGDTLCSVIQAFPVLLILAQNQKRCLTTPLIYKPPTPTQSPEYYEAYDALIQSLFHKNCHEHYSASYYSYDVPNYSPCHGHESHPSYPHAYPSYNHYPSFHGVHGLKGKVYNGSVGYGNGHGQVKNVKYKIVVKKNKVVKSKRRRPMKLIGFQNDRSERRYASFFGFPKNLVDLLPENVRNIPGRLTSIVYRPITTPDNQKNQYGLANTNNNQHGNTHWNTNHNQNEIPQYPNWNPHGNSGFPNQNGNPYPAWSHNGNSAEPNWNQNPNPVNQNQNQNSQQNNDNANQFGNDGKPINLQPSVYSTQTPIDADIPNDYVNFDDNKGTTSNPVTEGVKIEEKHNTKPVVADKPDVFDDRHGQDENISTEAPTQLHALTPVDSKDNVNFASFQDSCTTVEGDTGTCTVIFSCPQYNRLLTQARSSPDAVQLLRKVHCGFEGRNPKVCCPPSSIPTTPPVTTTTTTNPPEPASEGREVGDVMLQPPQCGVSNATSSRVVGGAPARLADFPWMALLGYKPRRGDETRWLCGGSLVSARHVLTAAHCIHGHENDLYQVRLGELDLARDDEGATPTDVAIRMKVKHEEYDPKSFTNDIGLLLLERSVDFTYLIRPICIPQDRELRARSFENYTPTIAGWGDTEFRGPAATHLQALQLPVVSNEFCANAYKQYKAQVIDERVLCAGYKKGGHDACQGDSGGPLMQPIWMPKEHMTYFYQIGVVSYGKKCAEIGFPGVYTRVTKFVPWIEKNMAATQSL